MRILIRFSLPLVCLLFIWIGGAKGFDIKPQDMISGSGALEVKGEASIILPHASGDAVKVTLAKDRRVYVEKEVEGDVRPERITFSFICGKINDNESDYRITEAKYPVYVQLVFDEKPKLSLRKMISHYWKAAWSKKVWTRRSLIYAFTNRMPRGSLVNSYVSVAVVSVGDETDAGKRVDVSRAVTEDYKMAYGGAPLPPLYRVVVGFEGDDQEKTGEVVFYGLTVEE